MLRASGVLLDGDDVAYVLAALDKLLQGRRASAQLADFIARLRKAAKSVVPQPDSDVSTGESARLLGVQTDSRHTALYDLLGSAEVAKVLGCTSGNVRDLRARGRLPAHKAGGRWLYPAAAVIARAERQAARRGR